MELWFEEGKCFRQSVQLRRHHQSRSSHELGKSVCYNLDSLCLCNIPTYASFPRFYCFVPSFKPKSTCFFVFSFPRNFGLVGPREPEELRHPGQRALTHQLSNFAVFKMHLLQLLPVATALLALAESKASPRSRNALEKREAPPLYLPKRQVPAEPKGVKTIISPNGINITYKEPGKEGVCETTPGVNSYSGFVNLAPNVHSFFWFFESRSDPKNDPITLWLNGGPGSDSLIGLFEELGPCNVTEKLTTMINPYSFSNVSNMLFLSQPVGVGFSYAGKAEGSIDSFTGSFEPASVGGVDGRWPTIDPTKIDTTNLAAKAAWEVLQGFYSALPKLDSRVKSTTFNLFTESYGGHYGPAFFNYFYEQNAKIANGTSKGKVMDFGSLGIVSTVLSLTLLNYSCPYLT
jgi:hypothetical protein